MFRKSVSGRNPDWTATSTVWRGTTNGKLHDPVEVDYGDGDRPILSWQSKALDCFEKWVVFVFTKNFDAYWSDSNLLHLEIPSVLWESIIWNVELTARMMRGVNKILEQKF